MSNKRFVCHLWSSSSIIIYQTNLSLVPTTSHCRSWMYPLHKAWLLIVTSAGVIPVFEIELCASILQKSISLLLSQLRLAIFHAVREVLQGMVVTKETYTQQLYWDWRQASTHVITDWKAKRYRYLFRSKFKGDLKCHPELSMMGQVYQNFETTASPTTIRSTLSTQLELATIQPNTTPSLNIQVPY